MSAVCNIHPIPIKEQGLLSVKQEVCNVISVLAGHGGGRGNKCWQQ